MFSDELDDEEIDVINGDGEFLAHGDESDESFHNDYIMNQPDDEFEEEGVQQYEEYIDEEEEEEHYPHVAPQYIPLPQYVHDDDDDNDGILNNQELYNAHYIDIDDDDANQRAENLLYDQYGNSYVEHHSPDDRLAAYPEMRRLPAFRRLKQKREMEEHPILSRPTFIPKKVFARTPEATELLDAIGFWPRPANEQRVFHHQRDVVPCRLSTKKIEKLPPPPKKMIKPPSPPPPVPYIPQKTPPNSLPLTPLPDRYYQRRLTLTGEQVGFMSDCVECNICGFLFRHKQMLDNHLLKHQRTGLAKIVSDKAGLVCPMKDCSIRSDSIATVIRHLKKSHPQTGMINFEQIYFKDFTEFKYWRTELEKLTLSRYSRTSGKQNVFSRSTYYQCHHSGSNPDKRPHRQRCRESKKLGKTCTAFFHLRENEDGTILLRGCTKHIGHGCDVRVLPLTDEIRMEIAQLLIAGLDETAIVEKMRSESDKKDRRYYIQNYEIRNVASKIDKIKEDFKARISAGEPLPDFAEMLTSPHDREYPVRRVRLACHAVPLVDEEGNYLELIDQPEYEPEYYEEPEYDEVDGEIYNEPESVDMEYVEETEAPVASPPKKSEVGRRTLRKLAAQKRGRPRKNPMPKIVPEELEEEEEEEESEFDEMRQSVKRFKEYPQSDEEYVEPTESVPTTPVRQSTRLANKKNMSAQQSDTFDDMGFDI